MSKPIKANRVVYLPKKDQLLIDGKPYGNQPKPPSYLKFQI